MPQVGRLRKKDIEDAELERMKKALDKSSLAEHFRFTRSLSSWTLVTLSFRSESSTLPLLFDRLCTIGEPLKSSLFYQVHPATAHWKCLGYFFSFPFENEEDPKASWESSVFPPKVEIVSGQTTSQDPPMAGKWFVE